MPDSYSILIKNANYLPVRKNGKRACVVKDASILIENGVIREISKSPFRQKSTKGEKIDAKDSLVLPGLVNAHTHLPETLERGVCDDATLDDWLWNHIWVMESRMGKKEAYAGAMLGCVEMIKCGTTSFIDQFYYAEELFDAVNKSGLRALLCPSVFDNCVESKTIERAFERAKEVISEKQGKSRRINWGIGPHAPYTVEKDMLLRIAEFADERNLPVHIHLQESLWEMEKAKKEFGMSPIKYLEKIGFFSDKNHQNKRKILGAHCVFVDNEDMEIMRKNELSVLHNPRCNLKLANGIAPVSDMLEKGINVAIGTDGCASNNNLFILEDLLIATILQKYLKSDPRVMPIEEAIELATINGARAIGLENEIGCIEEGKKADVIIVDMKGAHANPKHNILSNLIYASSSHDVNTTIVDGKILMHERKLRELDEQKVIDMARKASEVLLGKKDVR